MQESLCPGCGNLGARGGSSRPCGQCGTVLSGGTGDFTDKPKRSGGLSGERAVFTDKARLGDSLSVKCGVFTDKPGILEVLSGERAVFTDKVMVC